ncbi:MAG TPA: hypothetical protein VK939_10895 [Longimicrobiales bacterium]|nr:hypothetical protein [Longimicrobiales bacterium]
MRRFLSVATALTLGVLSFGCAEPESGISEEQFVAAVVALRQAAEASTADQFEARRDAILKDAGIGREDLYAFVRRSTRDPRRLSNAYDSAAARLRTPAVE